MSLPNEVNLHHLGSTGYNLTKSLRFRSSASAYMNRTPASAGNRQKMTFSFWVKRGQLYTSSEQGLISSNDNTLHWGASANYAVPDGLVFRKWNGASNDWLIQTTQVFRDPAAWYHIVVAVDTTQATDSNRVLMYVNGVQITAFSSTTYPSQNANLDIGNNSYTTIGSRYDNTNYFDGYLSEFNYVNGQQLTPSSFGENNATTGVWQPKKYTGTYGTNGFYLPFTNTTSTTTLGYDSSGNSNNWTVNNISLTAGVTYDSMTDVPTLTSATTANYAVLNAILPSSFVGTLTNGNLSFSQSVGCINASATIIPPSGKFYIEGQNTGGNFCGFGVQPLSQVGTNNGYAGANGMVVMETQSGKIYVNGTNTQTVSSYSTSDIIGITLDLDSGSVQFYKNGSTNGTAISITVGSGWTTYIGNGSGATTNTGWINFGQQPFTYTPPTGYVALNTYNLPTSTIVKGNTVMDATLYTGNGSTQSVTNASSFKPDLVWLKQRTGIPNNTWNLLADSVRGTGKFLSSNQTDAEYNIPQGLTAFNSNGFSLGADPDGSSNTGWNYSSASQVAWQWQAGQGTTSSNTNGSITSTVSVNPTAGFSICTFTKNALSNETIGHGLGVAPAMYIVKTRQSSGYTGWALYHKSLGYTYYMSLDLTDGATLYSTTWNSAPTSTVFGMGTGWTSTQNMVAYCWAEIAGFSKFGSYTGNGSTDGPFVYLGFIPKFVLIKRSDGGAEQWNMIDTSRNPYNTTTYDLAASSSGAETTSSALIDVTSNGFKLRFAGTPLNTSGGTYIYAAFAENPFKNALAR